MVRFEGSDSVLVMAAADGSHSDVLPVGARIPLGGNNAISRVYRTGEPARIDDYRQASGPIADLVRSPRPPKRRRDADRRQRSPVGSHAAGGVRGGAGLVRWRTPHRPVQRAHGDSHRQRRGASRDQAARRGAGRSTQGGDPRRRRRLARRALRRRGRRDETAARRRLRVARALRGGRPGHDARRSHRSLPPVGVPTRGSVTWATT
jgi:hypothetical protein